MSKFRRLIFALIILLFGNLYSQVDTDFPKLNDIDLHGAKFIQEKYFDGGGLWGHINGGADLYLEYGFDKLLFQEIQWQGNSFRVEFYRMIDAEAAFGIYSINHYKCNKQDTLTKFICIAPYQVQSALGSYYISIANDKGGKIADSLNVEIFTKVLSKLNEKLFELPFEIVEQNYSPSELSKLKFVKGVLGLQNIFPEWIGALENYDYYKLFALSIDIEGKKNGVIIFDNSLDYDSFIKINKDDILTKLYPLVTESK
ncbi:MAG: DUF6599 family protein [Melioribacteraceae bacterium]